MRRPAVRFRSAPPPFAARISCYSTDALSGPCDAFERARAAVMVPPVKAGARGIFGGGAMKSFAAIVFLLASICGSAGAQTPGFPTGASEVGAWMADYYVNNDVARIPEFLNWLQSGVVQSKASLEEPTAAFLAAVFASNPDRVAGWVSGVSLSGNA